MSGASSRMPMFPLGGVLFPHVFLPLRVFEPRYRRLVDDIMAGDGEFGVVLIERGFEVGGGDVRFGVATVARVIEATPQPDGGWLLGCVGTRRVEVTSWLDDDPYPVAMVSDLVDNDSITADAGDEIDLVVAKLRKVLAMRSEMNLPGAPATIEFADDPEARLWQACAVTPVGPMDDLRLLGAVGVGPRVTVLKELLDDEAMVLAHRLADG